MQQLNHVLIIPDGERRWARREFLTDLFRSSKSEFRSALQALAEEQIDNLGARIKVYAQTGIDSLYTIDQQDFLDTSKIDVPLEYLVASYMKGGQIFDAIIRWMMSNSGIPILSIYALQARNLGRSDEQVYTMIKAESEYFKRWSEDNEICERCNFKFVGDKGVFDAHKQRAGLREIIEKHITFREKLEINSSGKHLKIYILTPYDRDWEINQAIVDGAFNPKKLVVQEEVDLTIRAGNAKTPTSGALPYQTAYHQFTPLKQYFPDFTIEIVRDAIKAYGAKERESGL